MAFIGTVDVDGSRDTRRYEAVMSGVLSADAGVFHVAILSRSAAGAVSGVAAAR
jgi:hypothetical protein